MTNVREILIAQLREMGADGLCMQDCGCGIYDLAPCECLNIDKCVPAVLSLSSRKYVPLRDRDFLH